MTAKAAAASGPRLLRSAALASVGVASVLVLAKTAAWSITGAVSLLATLVDSLLDVAASALTLYTVSKAMKPADAEHRFGHSKAEALGVVGQAAFVTGSAIFLLIEAVRRLARPAPISGTDLGIVITAMAIVLSFMLVLFQIFVIRRTGSPAIRADSLHYRSDIAVGIGVLISLWLSREYGWVLVDPLYAIAVAGYILFIAWRLVREAIDVLMDRELPDEARRRIAAVVKTVPAVRGVDDLRTRSAGMRQFIQLHIELDPALSFVGAHAIGDSIEAEIETAFPGAEIILHVDPLGVDERRTPDPESAS